MTNRSFSLTKVFSVCVLLSATTLSWASDYPVQATASATTEARACSVARGMFRPQDRSPQACSCKGFRDNALFVCKAFGKASGQSDAFDQAVGDLRAYARELEKCNPDTDANQCERVAKGATSASFGVRN